MRSLPDRAWNASQLSRAIELCRIAGKSVANVANAPFREVNVMLFGGCRWVLMVNLMGLSFALGSCVNSDARPLAREIRSVGSTVTSFFEVQQLDANEFSITVLGDEGDDKEKVAQYALLAAAKVTLANNHDSFSVIHDTQQEVAGGWKVEMIPTLLWGFPIPIFFNDDGHFGSILVIRTYPGNLSPANALDAAEVEKSLSENLR